MPDNGEQGLAFNFISFNATAQFGKNVIRKP
jgi:hypothetical protein